MYGEFAEIYDLLMDGYDYERWEQFYEECCRRFGGTFDRVLEFGAGTGNMTRRISKKARQVVALDSSEEMLSIAKRKLVGQRNIVFLRGEMEAFQIENKFDLVLSACDAMNYLLTEEELLSAFRSAYRALDRFGLFVFDMSSVHKLSQTIGNRTFIYDTDEIFYCWENLYDERNMTLSMAIHFFREAEEGRYERILEEQIQRGYEVQSVLKFLEKAGFSDCYAFDPFDFEECRTDSERIAFVAVKKDGSGGKER